MKLIKVFEHQVLRCDATIFTDKHFEALARFNDQHRGIYCTLLHKAVRFKSYVGVIQIGDLSIEVLPKMDQSQNDSSLWQSILLELLANSQFVPIHTIGNTKLKVQQGSILSYYLHHFLTEVDQLLQKGLLKKYRSKSLITSSWKGKVDLNKQVVRDAQAKFGCYTQQQYYDTQHIWHAIIYQALKALKNIELEPSFQQRLERTLNLFPVQSTLKITADTFKKLRYDRKTIAYAPTIKMAELILTKSSILLESGRFSVLGLLFDMNKLFEGYVYRQLSIALEEGWQIERQSEYLFWGNKSLRPDIILRYGTKVMVIDCKWKQLLRPNPDDHDLRQIYVYQRKLGAREGWLLYPSSLEHTEYVDKFLESDNNAGYRARIVWAELIDFRKGCLNKKMGKQLFAMVTKQLESLEE